MIIAVTYKDGQVFQHFGHTEEFKLFRVMLGKIVASEIVPTNGQGHGALATFLSERGVDVLICGGIGAGAQNALTEAGIKFYAGVQGGADDVLHDFLQGKLVYNPNEMCNHHHEHHDGDCGHSNCGSHNCSGN